MTGVPVIPSGSILPQARAASATGRPRVRVHTMFPECASIASTVSLSVATISIADADAAGCQ